MCLKHIGFTVIFIGILEGIAETVAGLSKGYFGKQSDLSGKRMAFIRLGYALSAISKPMMAFFVYPAWISNIVDKKDLATAFGTYTGFQSICALIASSTCGLIWYKFGPMTSFLITAGSRLWS